MAAIETSCYYYYYNYTTTDENMAAIATVWQDRGQDQGDEFSVCEVCHWCAWNGYEWPNLFQPGVKWALFNRSVEWNGGLAVV